ncbi:putative F-box/LRR-repeat protein 2 [Heracleum sosnowskyi]|uniref:F-box/LRR-repeat protein 2 n=1 Tax=Heracleum sosnowskyi TaxID=360622 RepID=A0AAD8M3P7_9APIA|nr:putative F-box/LRR-repeat protein 2 [Heracleum sosnowskyi]
MTKQCEDLPEECWGIILKKLDHHSHFQSLSLVSKTFLALTNRLRHNFTLTNQTILLHGTISKFVNRFNHLKTLDFSKFKGNVDMILDTVFNSGLSIECLDVSDQEKLPVLTKNMRNLKVFKCANICCLSDADLVSISVMLPFLEELDISYPNYSKFDSYLKLDEFTVTDVGIEALWSSLRKLRRVNISGNHFITDRSVVSLSTNCWLLSEIVMFDCSFITHHACHFILCNCHHLNVISVNTIQIPPRVSSTYVRALRSIDISDSVTLSDECLILIAKACWPLESLSLRRCTGFTLFGISQLLSAYRSLKHLALVKTCFLTDQIVSELAQYLVNLVSINLDSCFHLTTLTFITLVTECPSLEHVEMSRTSVGNVDHSLVVKNKKIKSLKLSGNSFLSDKLLKCIASTCPNMELLNISSTYRTTEVGIADVLTICHGIRSLQITYCAGISGLGAGLKLPTLEVLNVANSGFGDEGLKTISQRCPGLLKLDMEGCVAATTKQVEELLRMCERLREINLKGCCSVKSLSVATWIVSLRRSYLKVIPPATLPFNNCHRHLWSHGCLLE